MEHTIKNSFVNSHLRSERNVKLDILLEQVKPISESLREIDIEAISTNSSTVEPNHLFIAIPGFKVDGHYFINDAIQKGASVIVGEKSLEELSIPYLSNEEKINHNFIPYIQVPNSRIALAKMACQFYGNPTKNKTVIGITGTNGKTTIAYMIKHILETEGYSCALFGTVQNVINGQVFPSKNTTPDALELQKQMSLSHDEFIIMEVSSHGITQHRVDGVEFDYCVFTNLDHEHLDYHHDIEEYFSVKASLFNQLSPEGKAIINTFNSWGEKLAEKLTLNGYNVCLLGEKNSDDLQIKKYGSRSSTIVFGGNQEIDLHLQVLGKHNIFNACMALLTVKQIGIPLVKIVEALERFEGVPGRFELFKHPKGAIFVVDYAHTADAFHHCLQTVKDEGARRIFHIFGFRGNRDTSKRKSMVEISKDLCDFTILTLDDLNDVSKEEMERALYELHDEVILDRTLAIQKVEEGIGKGDWVCITGKGPEPYKENFDLPTSSDKETIEFLIKQFK